MMRKGFGVTLLEVVIAFFIFSLIMTTVYLIFREGFSFYGKGSADTQTFQRMVIALDRISREVQEPLSRELYYPASEELMIPRSSSAIIFTREAPDGESAEVIGYYVDDERKEIVRVIYDPGYDPDELSTQREWAGPGAHRVIAGEIINLDFQGEETGLLKITIVAEGKNTPWYLTTKIRNGTLVR